MKKIITICVLFISSFALNAQSLSGTQTLPGIRGGASCYTVLNWKVNYQFVEKNGMFYISINNPSVSVANNSLYGSYSKSDLGLSVWPDSDPKPYNFNIEVTITYPGGNENLRVQMDAFSEGTFIGSANDSKFKNLSVSSFKVSSSGNMNYNGGRDGVVDKLIEEKKYASNKTNGTQSTSPSSPSTSSKSTNSQQTINPNDPNPMTNGTNGNYKAQQSDFQRNYETTQLIVNTTEAIIDLFTPSPEEIARREEANAEYARRKKIEKDIYWEKRKIDDKGRFDILYLPLMDTAIKGSENARMILYYASFHLFSTAKVPNRNTWFMEAFKNNNPDALMEVAEGKKMDDDWIYYLQNAANVGSVDAMLRLADWYNRKKKVVSAWSYGGGGDAKLALEWYTKAAEKGSPNAMYYLGMIYKYGQTSNDERYIRKAFLKHELVIDEKKALEWFEKSIQPNYPISLFATSSKTIQETYLDLSSYFNKEAYKELSLIYAKGKIVPKDKVKAKELLNLYESYGSHYDKCEF